MRLSGEHRGRALMMLATRPARAGRCRSIAYAATPSYSTSSTPTVLRVSRRCQRFARLPRHIARGVDRLTLIRYAPGGLVVRYAPGGLVVTASGRDVIEHEVAELIGAAL